MPVRKPGQRAAKSRPFLMVLSSPSGGGKTTVCRALLKNVRWLKRGITATTRSPRQGERRGRDYYFLSADEFQRRVKNGGFFEYARVHGNWYGTPRREVEQALKKGLSLVLVIDVQGAAAVKRQRPDAVLVFLVPPSLAELRRRLAGRATDSAEVVKIRLANARQELAAAKHFDHLVVNRELEGAVAEVTAIAKAERRRTRRPVA
jgi:guanylate kinase